MTTKQKIKAIKEAIEKAKNHQSKMDDVSWSVPALSSLKIRHLMNNLGAISTRYFECGVHKGGLFCSTIRNNDNLESITAIDNWESDQTNIEDQALPQFTQNAYACKPINTQFGFIVDDSFGNDATKIALGTKNIDLYLYDAAHDYESQRKAMTHFLPAMADEFIVCVDDWQYGDVKKGTIDGLADSGCKILFQQELLNEEPYTEDQHRNEEWWRGYAVFLLKKK